MGPIGGCVRRRIGGPMSWSGPPLAKASGVALYRDPRFDVVREVEEVGRLLLAGAA